MADSLLRICHVVASINAATGGPAVSVTRLASAQAAEGHYVSICSLDYREHGQQLVPLGIRLVSVPAGVLARSVRGWSPQASRTWRNHVLERAHIVHNHGLWMFPNVYARRAASVAKVPLVISPRGMLEAWALKRGRFKKWIAWHLYERANLHSACFFHATSQAELQSIRRVGLKQPVALIPNGVDLPAGEATSRVPLEKRWEELNGKRWLLFLSRLHPKKGVGELLEAWARVCSQFDDWQLIVAGQDLDGYGATIAQQVSRLGISDSITVTGMLDGELKSAALRNSEIMVLPTHSENFGLVIAEALAHGMPVITTKAAPWEDLIKHRCGWWIENPNEALHRCLLEALRKPSHALKEMGERGKQLVAESYHWPKVATKIIDVYRWRCGSGEQPAWVYP